MTITHQILTSAVVTAQSDGYHDVVLLLASILPQYPMSVIHYLSFYVEVAHGKRGGQACAFANSPVVRTKIPISIIPLRSSGRNDATQKDEPSPLWGDNT